MRSCRTWSISSLWRDRRKAGSTTSRLIDKAPKIFAPVAIDEDDLLTINYTSGTTARPKGVMITHRNAYLNTLGTLAHFQMSPEDRYLWTLPMFHANGWTFVWTVTARGAAHICLRKVDPAQIFELVATENVTTLCAAPTVLIGIANAPEAARKRAAGKVVRLLTAGAPPAAVDHRVDRERARLAGHAYLRPHGNRALYPRLRGAARA